MARRLSFRRKLLLVKTLQKARRKRQAEQQQILNFLLRRRLLLLNVSLVSCLLLSSKTDTAVVHRSCRRLARNTGWFELVWKTYSEARFRKTFRISRATFLYILEHIQHDLQRQTVTEEPYSPAFRLAICLYRLARGDYYYTISEMAGIGTSTVCEMAIEVSNAIINNLWEDCVSKHFPRTEQEFREKTLDMEERWQFPCCWSAIDGSHIPIKCPAGGLESCKEYHNFKNFYSIVLMGMVDAKHRFIWGSCGFPGNSHDSIIFQSTQLWSNISEGQTIPPIGKEVDGVTVPPLILGDSAFPFRSWLMKPFTNAILTPIQTNYNYRLSRARMVIEGCYGQLKGRWRVLMRKMESSPEVAQKMTLACMVLHNICIERGETLSKQLDPTLDPRTNQRRDRETNPATAPHDIVDEFEKAATKLQEFEMHLLKSCGWRRKVMECCRCTTFQQHK